jgi:hypothetical protein
VSVKFYSIECLDVESDGGRGLEGRLGVLPLPPDQLAEHRRLARSRKPRQRHGGDAAATATPPRDDERHDAAHRATSRDADFFEAMSKRRRAKLPTVKMSMGQIADFQNTDGQIADFQNADNQTADLQNVDFQIVTIKMPASLIHVPQPY